MNKIKVASVLLTTLVAIFALGKPVHAITNQVQIQQLPGYINTDNFKLSCSAITANLVDNDPITTTMAQFYYTKEGESEKVFGSSIDLSSNACQVQVTGNQVNGEAKYTFTVKLDSGEISSTTTVVDRSGPDPVGGFYKDGLSDGYRLHYHTPSNEDFSRVIIYRGNEQGFEADSSHEIATVTCSRDSDMTYEDHSGSDKYYLIRAIDKAGNSSGLAGDGGGTTTTVESSSSPISGKVVILPSMGQGSVLGEEASPTPTMEVSTEDNLVEKVNTFAGDTPQPFRWILTHKKITLGLLLIAFLLTWRIRQYKNNK